MLSQLHKHGLIGFRVVFDSLVVSLTMYSVSVTISFINQQDVSTLSYQCVQKGFLLNFQLTIV